MTKRENGKLEKMNFLNYILDFLKDYSLYTCHKKRITFTL